MMNTTHEGVLVPLAMLHANEAAIRAATEEATTQSRMGDDPSYEMFFRYYLVFSEDLLRDVGLSPLNPEMLFYNQYYWFKRFVDAYMAKQGFDAGLEQQTFKLLESAPDGVDWTMIDSIDARLEEESAAQ